MWTKFSRRLISGKANRKTLSTFSMLIVLVGWLALVTPCFASGLTMSNNFSWLPWLWNLRFHKTKVHNDMERLKDREVVLIVDKSHSMLVQDCQSSEKTGGEAAAEGTPISRWQWCKEQILDMAQKADGTLPKRFRVVAFSGDSTVYDNVDPPGVNMIFEENRPAGPTCADRALKDQLDSYFTEREARGKVRPLTIAMITDGCPDNPSRFKYEIVDATQKMSGPHEISITILQVGHDERATKLLSDLRKLTSHSAKFDIVNAVSFEQLQQEGLVKALADSVGERSSASCERGTDVAELQASSVTSD